MHRSAGLTLVELLAVVAISSLFLITTTAVSVPWMARETLRSAVQDVRSFMQLARMEAASRNRECRFVVDTAAGELSVWDGNGTATVGDDRRLHHRQLPTSVDFARPDGGSVASLDALGGSLFQTVFAADGVATDGAGGLYLHSGDGFAGITVFDAGGLEMSYWDGSAWHVE